MSYLCHLIDGFLVIESVCFMATGTYCLFWRVGIDATVHGPHTLLCRLNCPSLVQILVLASICERRREGRMEERKRKEQISGAVRVQGESVTFTEMAREGDIHWLVFPLFLFVLSLLV